MYVILDTLVYIYKQPRIVYGILLGGTRNV